MNNGLVPADWAGLFLAAATAGATLSGLLAVTLAGHMRSIAGAAGGVARAAEAVVLPLAVSIVGLAGLWPADRASLVGVAIAVVGIGAWLVVTGLLALGGGQRPGTPIPRRVVARLVVGQLTTLPAIAAGFLLASSTVPGLDLVLPAIAAGIVGGPLLGALLLLDLARVEPTRVDAARRIDPSVTDTARVNLPR